MDADAIATFTTVLLVLDIATPRIGRRRCDHDKQKDLGPKIGPQDWAPRLGPKIGRQDFVAPRFGPLWPIVEQISAPDIIWTH